MKKKISCQGWGYPINPRARKLHCFDKNGISLCPSKWKGTGTTLDYPKIELPACGHYRPGKTGDDYCWKCALRQYTRGTW